MTAQERIIGIDVGLKRIGLAQSDLLGILASPVGTFNHQEIVEKIRELRDKSTITKIIVGWPISMRGHENDITDLVQSFVRRLEKAFPDITIVKLDERFTSNLAKQSVLDSGISKKKRREKGLIDKVAATIILQNYLDSNATY